MLDLARGIARQTGPFSSVSMDVGRADATAAEVITARFRAAAAKLARLGAPADDIDALREAMLSLPGRGGPLTRLAVARKGRVELDVVLPGTPPRDEAAFGAAPHLLPLIRAARRPAPYLVVDVDRAGADIEAFGADARAMRSEEVVGSHDVLHKAPVGGWAHRRIEARVEDSWDRNAAEVATEINRVTVEIAPAMILVDGDPYAVSAVIDGLSGAAAGLVTRLSSGGRAGGVNQEAHRAAIDAALAARAEADRRAIADQFAGMESKQLQAAQGLSDVAAALRRGQVERMLLIDDPSSTFTLWTGRDPMQLGTERADLEGMGVPHATSMRADAVLVRAALASGADVVIFDDGDLRLVDGIGALLRWTDPSTPHDAVPAMPGHGQGPGIGEAQRTIG